MVNVRRAAMAVVTATAIVPIPAGAALRTAICVTPAAAPAALAAAVGVHARVARRTGSVTHTAIQKLLWSSAAATAATSDRAVISPRIAVTADATATIAVNSMPVTVRLFD